MRKENLKNLSIGYLGPEGTFTEQALKKLVNGSIYKYIPQSTIKEVIKGVTQGDFNLGFVPLENSVEGSVNETLDMLVHNEFIQIIRESVMPIRHNLILPKGMEIDQIEEVYSHPQAIAQCRNNLNRILPKAKLIFTNSTSEAIRIIEEKSGKMAAVGSLCGLKDGLEIKLFDIQDFSNNETRFILLGNQQESLDLSNDCDKKKYKTSIVCSLPDEPGALYELLKIFADNKVNLKRIESRPTKNKLGEYLFFVDIEGKEKDYSIKRSLLQIENMTDRFKNLGSYVCE